MAIRSGPSAPIPCPRDRASAGSHADHVDHVETACDRAGVVLSSRAIGRLTLRLRQPLRRITRTGDPGCAP